MELHRRLGRRSVGLALVAITVLTTSCGGDDDTQSGIAASTAQLLSDQEITVASFDFGESVVLAEVYSQGLEAAGFKVRRAFGLGAREFVGSALATGLVEFVPEYAGTAAEFFSLGAANPSVDIAATHTELKDALVGENVVALDAAPAQDANTFVVTRATAARLKLQRLSDLRPVAGELTFGGPPECASRPLCLKGLADTYGLEFGEVLTTDAGGQVTHNALNEGVIDVALLFTTDPQIAADDLVELDDDLGLQPAESVTPLVRSEVVDEFGPDLVAAVNRVSSLLTTADLRELNQEAGATGSEVPEVVSTWWSQVSA